MAIITMPTNLILGSFNIAQARFDLSEMSETTGASQDRSFGPPRWRLSISAPSALSIESSAVWEALILKLRGRVNHLAAWDIMKPAPRGTMRGTLTLSGAHAQGATVLNITGGAGQAGTTLLAGDWIQVGSGTGGQLFKVVTDATANGAGLIAATVEPPVRPVAGFAGGTAVTWDKALGHYKVTTQAPQWGYVPSVNAQSGFALDLMEQWT